MKILKILLFGFAMLIGRSVSAQATKPSDFFHDKDGNTFHQLFLDFQAKELLEIHYTTNDSLVEGQISSDGYSIVIKNYPGDKAVKVKVLDAAGNEKEVTKSKCFIDPVLMNL